MSFQRGPNPPPNISAERRKHFFDWSSRHRRAGHPYSWHEFLAFEKSQSKPEDLSDDDYEAWRRERNKANLPSSFELYEAVYRKDEQVDKMDEIAKTPKTKAAQALLAARRAEIKLRRDSEKSSEPKESAYHLTIEADRRAFLDRMTTNSASSQKPTRSTPRRLGSRDL